jgi:hypothetical protein
MIARIFGQITELPNAASDDKVRVHGAQKNKAPDLQRGLWPWTLGHMGGEGSGPQTR